MTSGIYSITNKVNGKTIHLFKTESQEKHFMVLLETFIKNTISKLIKFGY